MSDTTPWIELTFKKNSVLSCWIIKEILWTEYKNALIIACVKQTLPPVAKRWHRAFSLRPRAWGQPREGSANDCRTKAKCLTATQGEAGETRLTWSESESSMWSESKSPFVASLEPYTLKASLTVHPGLCTFCASLPSVFQAWFPKPEDFFDSFFHFFHPP